MVNLNARVSSVGVTGAATSTAIPVGSMKATDLILAVLDNSNAGLPTQYNQSAFTPAAGSFSSSSIDTSGKKLVVLYYVA